MTAAVSAFGKANLAQQIKSRLPFGSRLKCELQNYWAFFLPPPMPASLIFFLSSALILERSSLSSLPSLLESYFSTISFWSFFWSSVSSFFFPSAALRVIEVAQQRLTAKTRNFFIFVLRYLFCVFCDIGLRRHGGYSGYSQS